MTTKHLPASSRLTIPHQDGVSKDIKDTRYKSSYDSFVNLKKLLLPAIKEIFWKTNSGESVTKSFKNNILEFILIGKGGDPE